MSDEGYWFVALGLGLVVAVVAAALLETLFRQVRRVESGAEQIWAAGKQVARNTATTWLLGETSARLDELVAEAGRHGQLLRGEPVHPSGPQEPEDRSTTASPAGPAPAPEAAR